MTRLVTDEETHRLAKSKAAIAGLTLQAFIRLLIHSADPAKTASANGAPSSTKRVHKRPAR